MIQDPCRWNAFSVHESWRNFRILWPVLCSYKRNFWRFGNGKSCDSVRGDEFFAWVCPVVYIVANAVPPANASMSFPACACHSTRIPEETTRISWCWHSPWWPLPRSMWLPEVPHNRVNQWLAPGECVEFSVQAQQWEMRHVQRKTKWPWGEFIPESEKWLKFTFSCRKPKNGDDHSRRVTTWGKPLPRG